jgi:acetyltransferase
MAEDALDDPNPPPMDKVDLRTAVLATIAAIAPETDPKQIPGDRPLRDAVDLDSLDWLNVVEALQTRFAVEIPTTDRSRITTLDALVDYLASRLSAPSAPAPNRTAPVTLPRRQWLVDGQHVTLRPIGRDDADLEADFVRHLSAESRYKRFMSTITELSPGKLASMTDVDQVQHVALAAVVEVDGAPAFVGVARYILDATGRRCEFAIAVADAWQGSGLAGLLMQALIDVASARGLAAMEGQVLRTNRKMLRFARQLGFVPQRGVSDRDTVNIVRAL